MDEGDEMKGLMSEPFGDRNTIRHHLKAYCQKGGFS